MPQCHHSSKDVEYLHGISRCSAPISEQVGGNPCTIKSTQATAAAIPLGAFPFARPPGVWRWSRTKIHSAGCWMAASDATFMTSAILLAMIYESHPHPQEDKYLIVSSAVQRFFSVNPTSDTTDNPLKTISISKKPSHIRITRSKREYSKNSLGF